MKFKKNLLTILVTMVATPSVFASTNTIDLYSSNSTSRYSQEGKVKNLNLQYDKNVLMIPEANQDSYILLNKETPYFTRSINENQNLYQLLQEYKGKDIEEGKIIDFKDNFVVVLKNKTVSFIPLEKIKIPEVKNLNEEKGLMSYFKKDINPEDNLFISQYSNELSFNNSYSGQLDLKNKKIKITHFFNINNNSQKTFKDVFLNFFLSENFMQQTMPRFLNMSAPMMEGASLAKADMVAQPVFEENNVANLETVNIKEKTTIYPNLNKVKYKEKDYPVEEITAIDLEPVYWLNVNTKIDDDANKEIKKFLLNKKKTFVNQLEIKVTNKDIFPSGLIEVYDNLNERPTLILSNGNINKNGDEIILNKNINNDLKIVDVQFTKVKNEKTPNTINGKILSYSIKNTSDKNIQLKILNKKYSIPAMKTTTVNFN